MFGDDKSAVDSSMTPSGKIHKRHAALLFHRVRESIASGIVTYQFIEANHNLEDTHRNHWTHNDIWPTLKPILFWPGDNIECFDNVTL